VEAGTDFSIGAEPVDFCGKSHITQLSQDTINKVSAAELWKEYLAMIIGKPICPVGVQVRLLWLCMEVTVVDPAVRAISPFDLWVNGQQVIPYPSACPSPIFCLV
jgi:hypothetical protein